VIGSQSPGTPDASAVLRRSLLAWGWGHLALGRRRVAIAWILAELGGFAIIAVLVAGLASSDWYLLPFLAGIVFIAAWAFQAVQAYRQTERPRATIGPLPPRSPAAVLAWLSIPLLVWGTGFWLVAATASSPSAVIDRFETAWPDAASAASVDSGLGLSAAGTDAARTALQRLRQLCAAGTLNPDCADTPGNLLRDVRLTLTARADLDRVRAVAEVVRFERKPTRFLGLFSVTQLVPVHVETVLTLDLRAVSSPLPGGIDVGARRWQIVNASAE
jgi:hypothetical protein